MKKLCAVISLGVLSMATMMAQRPFGSRNNGGQPPDPATMVQHQVARLTALLNLTTAQASQATTIFTEAANQVTPLQSTLNTDRDSLHNAVKSNTTASIDQLSSSIGTLEGQILDIQSKADAAFYAILTADQQAKLNPFGGFGRGFGRGPGGPPPGRH